MGCSSDESAITYPEVFTLHWEGPAAAVLPPDPCYPDSPDEERERLETQRAGDALATGRSEQAQALWEQIRSEAIQKGDARLWERKLDAYWWVKVEQRGTARAYASANRVNHATVRTWIADVSKLAYQVGYRLHEDRLLLVGEAPPGLQRLRELVNDDAGSSAATAELQRVAGEFRGEDPYFHLNEAHVLRARGRLHDSDEALKEGLAVAEAPRARSLLWNARGQTLWECNASSGHPLPDHLKRAEKAFRRAAILDQTTYFPFVNLAQLAVDGGDFRRAEYWMVELGAARKGMDEPMKEDLARYLHQAEWTGSVERTRFWKSGPGRWLREAVRKGVIPLVALALGLGLFFTPGPADATYSGEIQTVSHSGSTKARSGAGGN